MLPLYNLNLIFFLLCTNCRGRNKTQIMYLFTWSFKSNPKKVQWINKNQKYDVRFRYKFFFYLKFVKASILNKLTKQKYTKKNLFTCQTVMNFSPIKFCPFFELEINLSLMENTIIDRCLYYCFPILIDLFYEWLLKPIPNHPTIYYTQSYSWNYQ